MRAGRILSPAPGLEVMADRCAVQMLRLPKGTTRLTNPHIYKVAMSAALHRLRSELMRKAQENQPGYRKG
jgi:nicotinate phosphoribosyltransferase